MKTTFRKALAGVLTLALLAGCSSEPKADPIFVPGTYTGTGDGFGGKVSVTITVDETKITEVKSEGANETAAIGGAALSELDANLLAAQLEEFDGVSGATITSAGYKAAAASAIAQAKGGEAEKAENVAVTYNAGTYEGTGEGYIGPVTLSVTFGEDSIESIEVVNASETAHVGTYAYDIMFADAIAANGSGIDSVSGATFTSRAIKEALAQAAEAAGASDLEGFKNNTFVHEAQATIEETYDVVILGGGGAGVTAAAQVAQNGKTVALVEKEADVGGNTLVAGCAFQSFYQYSTWDPTDPEATEGVCPYDGQTYPKAKANLGTLNILRTILAWNEDEFDGTIDDAHPFTAGDMEEVAARGVHAEWLPVLKDLKEEIKVYLDWADAKIAAGSKETDLAVFSTINLHLFQTYYGGLRANNAGTEWTYSNVELVKQFVENIPTDKMWLSDQGATFDWGSTTSTLIGCLWQRINRFIGNNLPVEETTGKYATYFIVPLNTMTTANEANKLYLRTTADELIVEDGKVTGVHCTQYDGTEVILHANNGVIIATGGYGANIEMVVNENEYWDKDKIGMDLLTTNRSLAMGEGITMAQAVGADVAGMGFTQLMPLGWAKDGKLAGGNGETVIFISPEGTPNAGKRFVDESAERDVLSKGQLDNGGKNGLTVQLMKSGATLSTLDQTLDKADKEYFMTLADACEFLNLDYDTVYETVTVYDAAVIAQDLTTLPVHKGTATATILNYNEDGTPDLDTVLSVRFLAPSTHHTMGGLVVDTERHVLDTNGNAIPGLFAAGEVTTGFFAGNRLGGNAISEIIASGRIAANAVCAD